MTAAEALGQWDKADPAPPVTLPPDAVPVESFALAGGGTLEFFPHPAGAGHVLVRTFPGGRTEWRQR